MRCEHGTKHAVVEGGVFATDGGDNQCRDANHSYDAYDDEVAFLHIGFFIQLQTLVIFLKLLKSSISVSLP